MEDASGVMLTDPTQIENVMVSHFEGILAPGNFSAHSGVNLNHISTTGILTENEASIISKQVDLDEIKATIKRANPSKLPGSDGFNAHSLKFVGLLL